MSEFVALFNPDGLTSFTPDIILTVFGFCLVMDCLVGIIDCFLNGWRDK